MDKFDIHEPDVFDYFNGFIKSDDLKVVGKLVARSLFFDKVKHLPGDIVECGVFKGTGMLTFLKLKALMFPKTTIKRVIGFDFFNDSGLLETLHGHDKESMSSYFSSRNPEFNDISFEGVTKKIKDAGFHDHEFELISGDLSESSYKYVDKNPGFKISLLYIDVDLQGPTYHALKAFWDRIQIGGMVVFDEYAYHQWSEAAGADAFFKDMGVDIRPTNFICPSAYVVKTH